MGWYVSNKTAALLCGHCVETNDEVDPVTLAELHLAAEQEHDIDCDNCRRSPFDAEENDDARHR